MKKLKRNHSVDGDKMHPKLPQNLKKDKANKPKLKQKKTNSQLLQKQNTYVEFMSEKQKFFKANIKKTSGDKKVKQRSKSILDAKKSARDLIDSEYPKQIETFYQYCKTNQVKEQMVTNDPLDSFRYDQSTSKDKILGRLPQKSQHGRQRESSTQFKNVWNLDKEVQCSGFILKGQLKHNKESNQIKRKEYLQKIQALEKEIEQIHQQTQFKLTQLQITHQKQKKLLKSQVQALEKRNFKLSDQNKNLEITVDAQKTQINTQHEIHQLLQQKLIAEQKIKRELISAQQSSENKIKVLEAELLSFEENLNDFQKIKEAYEIRLQTLETDKQRIKGNAQELLQILQKIRDKQQID